MVEGGWLRGSPPSMQRRIWRTSKPIKTKPTKSIAGGSMTRTANKNNYCAHIYSNYHYHMQACREYLLIHLAPTPFIKCEHISFALQIEHPLAIFLLFFLCVSLRLFTGIHPVVGTAYAKSNSKSIPYSLNHSIGTSPVADRLECLYCVTAICVDLLSWCCYHCVLKSFTTSMCWACYRSVVLLFTP